MNNGRTKVTTGKVRFSYVNMWEPRSVNGGEAKYGVCLIIPKFDIKTVEEIKAAIEAAILQGRVKLGDNLEGLKLPLRDGDAEKPEDEVYRNSYFINANSVDKPGLVDRNKKEIIDQSEFYSGCYGRAIIRFYAFNKNGNRGIACGLENLQKFTDGEPLGGRSRAEDEFTVWEGDGVVF